MTNLELGILVIVLGMMAIAFTINHVVKPSLSWVGNNLLAPAIARRALQRQQLREQQKAEQQALRKQEQADIEAAQAAFAKMQSEPEPEERLETLPVILPEAAPEPLVPDVVERKNIGRTLAAIGMFPLKLVRLMFVRIPVRAGMAVRERVMGRRMAARRTLQRMQPAIKVSSRMFTGGDTIRIATTYRLLVDGEWQSVTRVVEPVHDKRYWLAGSPEENPEIEGYLDDRRRLAHLSSAVH